ncbi:ERVV2 protein, partial [Chroicocephalus maculipennis]|nr:ERVV2 protein [Chroicocephalus maculipennis]
GHLHSTPLFFPWLGASELEKVLVNVSVAIEIFGYNIADAIMALQEEVSQLSRITLRNIMALDTLLASQGGVCTIINTSCCM